MALANGNEQPLSPPDQQIGMVSLQPLQDGGAIAQISIAGACAATIVIPKPLVVGFMQNYRAMLKSNQGVLQAVQKSKLS